MLLSTRDIYADFDWCVIVDDVDGYQNQRKIGYICRTKNESVLYQRTFFPGLKFRTLGRRVEQERPTVCPNPE